jgi:hypothetical protein
VFLLGAALAGAAVGRLTRGAVDSARSESDTAMQRGYGDVPTGVAVSGTSTYGAAPPVAAPPTTPPVAPPPVPPVAPPSAPPSATTPPRSATPPPAPVDDPLRPGYGEAR